MCILLRYITTNSKGSLAPRYGSPSGQKRSVLIHGPFTSQLHRLTGRQSSWLLLELSAPLTSTFAVLELRVLESVLWASFLFPSLLSEAKEISACLADKIREFQRTWAASVTVNQLNPFGSNCLDWNMYYFNMADSSHPWFPQRRTTSGQAPVRWWHCIAAATKTKSRSGRKP